MRSIEQAEERELQLRRRRWFWSPFQVNENDVTVSPLNVTQNDKGEGLQTITERLQESNEETKPEPETGILGLFRYGGTFDLFLMAVGMVFSVLTGASLPLIGLAFGSMTNVMADVTKRGFKNVSILGDNLCNDNDCSTEDDRLTREEFVNYMINVSHYYFYIAILALIASFVQTFCWETSCERQIYRLKKTYFSQVLRQDISWFDLNLHGNLETKLSDDIERVREGIGNKFALVIMHMSMFVSGILIGLYADWLLTLTLLVAGPLILYTASSMAEMAAASAEREQLKYADALGIATEILTNIKTVAAFGTERSEHYRYSKALYAGRSWAMYKYISYSFGLCVINLVLYGAYAFGFWSACFYIKFGFSTPGSCFTVFFSMMMGAFSVGSVIPHLNSVTSAVGSARNLFRIIDRIPTIDPYSFDGTTIKNFDGYIRFEDVSFSYPSRREFKVLSSLDLDIQPGKKIAIVGHSGAGKSSIINLIMRFYDSTAGQISFDGVNIRNLNLKWLRSNIGLVSQEPVLFGVSIYENIRYGRDDVTKDQILSAAKLANAHSFITELSQGYDTLVGEKGGKLSGGQKQRIAIARAIVREPKILLLDEATSSLDYHSESIVQEALQKVMKGRTTIIVAHRLSTIRNADMIYVLKDGRVVESGDHDTLMSLTSAGYYYELVRRQKEEKSSKVVKKSGEPGPSTSKEDILETAKEEVAEVEVQDKKEEEYQFVDVKGSVFCRVLSMNKDECHLILGGLLACMIAGSIQPVFAFLYGEFFSTFSSPSDEMDKKRHLWTIVLSVFGLVSGISMGAWSFLMASSAEHLLARVRDRAMLNVMQQEISWFDYSNCSASQIMTRMARDVPLMKHVGGLRLGQIFSSVTGLIIALAMAFAFGWRLALWLVTLVPLVILGNYHLVTLVRKNIFRDLSLLDNAAKVASECVQNVKTVQALGRENEFVEQYMEYLRLPFNESKKEALFYAASFAGSQSVLYMMYFVAFRIGAELIGYGYMTPVDVFRVFFALAFTAVVVGTSAAYLPDYSKGVAASKRLFRIMAKRTRASPLLVVPGIRPAVIGKVTFRNVKFYYPTRSKNIIFDDFDLEIGAGKTVAIVGKSGCGKSTLFALLERFYFPLKGFILMDGEDIRKFNLQYLRSQMGLVTQEPVLLNCSIKKNIMYGLVTFEKDISDEQVFEAAKKANIHDFIMSLPEGYETMCGEGGQNLSGGQKQRIAIARALIRNPKILLLDEATSSLDSENEKLVQEALDNAREGRTCIVIAHRLSTIENADAIAVLDGGKIIEFGKHKDLMALKGMYHKLYHAKA